MKEVGSSAMSGAHFKGYAQWYKGYHEGISWAISATHPQKLQEIERHLGLPMLLAGLLTAMAGFPVYLESRPGYGKTTMARAIKKRLDALYQKLSSSPSAARELAEFPFADIIIVEAELVGYLYVAGTANPIRGENQAPTVVETLANPPHSAGQASTLDEARQKASDRIRESVNIMTVGDVLGTIAIAPPAAIATALQRAVLWHAPNRKIVKPVLLWYDNAQSPGFLEMVRDRLKTALAADVVCGMPGLQAVHIFAANPNQIQIPDELASRLFPVIIPAGASIEFALRGYHDFDQHLDSVGRSIAEETVSRVLGKPYEEATQEEIERQANAIREWFRNELNTNHAQYALAPQDKDTVLEKDVLDYLSGGMGATHYEDAIGLAINHAGLDALTAGWHLQLPESEEQIYQTLCDTPGYAMAYTPEELKEVAERHFVFATALARNTGSAKYLIDSDKSPLNEWRAMKRILNNANMGINWYNERSYQNSGYPVDQPMMRTACDWQRLVHLTASFLTLGRPDMAVYTIGTICGIDPDVPAPQLTIETSPSEIDKQLEQYFHHNNLTPSARNLLESARINPETYAAALKELARATVFTTQTADGAGEHTIHSITEPCIDTNVPAN